MTWILTTDLATESAASLQAERPNSRAMASELASFIVEFLIRGMSSVQARKKGEAGKKGKIRRLSVLVRGASVFPSIVTFLS